MKRFLIDICLGLIIFGITWILTEYTMAHVDIQNDYSYKYNYVKANSAIKTLLIGHSHFENSINPYLMGDSVFDFAISGRWIYWDALLAQDIFPTMPNLRVVIIPLGYHHIYASWHYNGLRDIDEEYAYMYSKYMHKYYDRFPECIYFCSALYCNKMGIKYWQNEQVDSLGYSKIIGQERDWKNIHNVPSDMLTKKYVNESYSEYRLYLIQIAQACYKNNIRFIAVTCPCANCYIENTCEEGINNLYALIDSVRVHYPIEYKNYLDDADFRADSLYYNCSHLNSKGADKFAIRVKEDFGL